MVNMKIAENIKNLRKEYSLSQKQLADIVETTFKTVSHWETGYTEPSIEQLVALANFFDVTIDELVGREKVDF